ncbi:MAG: MFS transporter [Acidobacteriota bacterium]
MLQSPLVLLRRLPRTVQILVIGTLVNRLGTFILPFLTLVLTREFAMTGAKAGLLLTMYGIGSLVSILAGGMLTDMMGRRQTALLSLVGSGALAVALAFAPSAGFLIPVLLFFGFLGDLYRPASSAIIGDVLPSKDRAVGFSALRVAVNLGFAFGAGIGGFIVDWNWRVLFAADGVTTLLFAGVVYFGIPETRGLATNLNSTQPAPQAIARDYVYHGLLFGSFSFAMVIFSLFTVLPLTITDSARYPTSMYGVLIAVNGVLITLCEVSAVAWLQRYRRLRVAALGFVLAGLGFGLIGLFMHWTWFLLAVLLGAVAEMMVLPQQMSFLADWAPPEARGRYLGLFGATWSLALIVNPVLLLPLHAALPESAFWPLLLVLLLPAALVVRHLDMRADRPERLRGSA